MSLHELRCPECGYDGTDRDAGRASATVRYHNDRVHGGDPVAEVREVTVCAVCRQPLGDDGGTESRRGEPVHRRCLSEVDG